MATSPVPTQVGTDAHGNPTHNQHAVRADLHPPPYYSSHPSKTRHSIMQFVVIFGVILSQFVLVFWKTKYYSYGRVEGGSGQKCPNSLLGVWAGREWFGSRDCSPVRSFRNTTLLGLYFIPLIFSLYHGFWRMIIVFVIFSAINAIIIRKALRKPLEAETPRIVYMWFYRIFQVCSNTALLGYVITVLDFFLYPKTHSLVMAGMLMIFYGMYYGVLGRDFSELCSDWMAVTMGYTGRKDEISSKSINPNLCGICGGHLKPVVGSQDKVYPIYKLSCQHEFHEPCVRGWIIVGKKDTCPYCSEKVVYQTSLLSNPWAKQSVLYGQFLDAMRYLIVWNPIMVYMLNALVAYFDPPDIVEIAKSVMPSAVA